MTLNIAAGQVAVPSQNNTGSTLCSSDAVEQVVLAAAPPSGQNRIDVVACHPRGADLDGGSNNDFIFDVVQGTAATAGSEVAPAVPAGRVALANVTVPGGAAAIVAGNIVDVRPGGLGMGAGGLPPPITSGSTIQAWQDSTGEWFVAKNGVNGGTWRKARDVLHAHVYRSASWSFSAGEITFNFDTAVFDAYGLFTPGGNFTCPIPGLWQVASKYSHTPVGTNYTYMGVTVNGVVSAYVGGFNTSLTAGSQTACTPILVKAAAGDHIGHVIGASAIMNGTVGQPYTWGTLDYIGTG
jgi:hypothetical protein